MSTHTIPFPEQVVCEPTAACSQACLYCSHKTLQRPKGTMVPELWTKIVTEVGAVAPFTEVWGAYLGESMLLGDRIFDMLAEARRAGCRKLTLNTNGTRLTTNALHRLGEGNLDRLIVSCDALTQPTHEIVRPLVGKGLRLSGVFSAVAQLIELAAASPSAYPIIEMQFSVFPENEHEVDGFITYWLKRGVVAKTRPQLHWSGSLEGGRDSMTERVPCPWVKDTIGIYWDGRVAACACDPDAGYIAGSVLYASISEIWNGPLAELRALHENRAWGCLPEICKRCNDWAVKRAEVCYPNPEMQARYEAFCARGRTWREEHRWERG